MVCTCINTVYIYIYDREACVCDFLLRCLCVSDRMASQDLFIEHPPAHIMEVRIHNLFSISSLNKAKERDPLTSSGLSFSF